MSGSAIFKPEETNSGTVTSWIPLTTSFSAEPACSKAIYLQRLGNFVAFDPFYVSLSADSTRCLPFEGTLWWNQAGTALNNVGLRQTSSIGPVACPAAFTTAFTLELSDSSTKVACCPSDYAFQGTILEKGQIGQCKSALSAGIVITYLTTNTDQQDSPWFQTTSTIGTGENYVDGVHINGWNFGDEQAVSITTDVSTSTSSTTSLPSSLPSPSISNTPATPSVPGLVLPLKTSSAESEIKTIGGGGLPNGAKVKIGVGVGVAVIGIGIFALLLYILQRRKRKRALATLQQTNGGRSVGALDLTESAHPAVKYELESVGGPQSPESPNPYVKYELPTQSRSMPSTIHEL